MFRQSRSSHKAENSLLEISDYGFDNVGSANLVEDTHGLGELQAKKVVSLRNLSAVFISLLCLVFGILTITPHLSIAWHLGFSGQIVVVGFLLGIMNLCTLTILPYAFLLIEARFGPSRLQNFEAILAGSVVTGHASPHWRMAAIFLIGLPLGLSVAYKRFLGGRSSADLSGRNDMGAEYGIGFPRVGTWEPGNDAIYLGVTSMAPFRSMSELGQATYPDESQFPIAYGYNILLLNDDSAAILDTPTPSYLSRIRSRISGNETWHIEASVDAYIATYNISSDRFTQDDSFWWDAASQYGLSSVYTYQMENDVSYMFLGTMVCSKNHQMYYGIYPSSTISYYSALVSYPTPSEYSDPVYDEFRGRAQLYDIRRGRCLGTWDINTTSILLTGGSCDDPEHSSADSSILDRSIMWPYYVDALPPLVTTYEKFVHPPISRWLNATNVVSIANMYWARAVFMINRTADANTTFARPYILTGETVISVRGSLRADVLLYLVLAVQPIITCFGFLITIWLYKVPIGPGFGTTAILAGLDVSTARLVKGAALSGKLETPLRLEIMSITDVPKLDETNPDGLPPSDTGTIRYRLTQGDLSSIKPELRSRKLYG